MPIRDRGALKAAYDTLLGQYDALPANDTKGQLRKQIEALALVGEILLDMREIMAAHKEMDFHRAGSVIPADENP